MRIPTNSGAERRCWFRPLALRQLMEVISN